MTYSSTLRLIIFSSLTREAPICSRWWITQKPATHQSVGNKRQWNDQSLNWIYIYTYIYICIYIISLYISSHLPRLRDHCDKGGRKMVRAWDGWIQGNNILQKQHLWTDGEDMHKLCASSSQTKPQHGEGRETWSSIPSQGAPGKC